jgi:serine/threonine protein kinase
LISCTLREGFVMPLQAGNVLAHRFEVRSQIGAGAFGAVYLAYDRDLSRLVAIKELSVKNSELDTKEYRAQKQKFERESRALSQFQHTNVVSVYQSLHEDDADYLVFEYVAGGSLRKQLDTTHRLSVERSVAITVDICRAVDAITKYGMVHRDIKPGNILLTPDGTAKLTDFGIAQLSNASERSQATAVRHPGTPKYMSPEQENSVGYLDERSDLYSLGLVLYEMLTGQAYKAARKPARQINAEIPRWLDGVITKALQPDPVKRYQTAREMEQALLRTKQSSSAAPTRSVGLILVGAAALGVLAIVGLFVVPTLSSMNAVTLTSTPKSVVGVIKSATPTITPTPIATVTATATPRSTATSMPTPTEMATETPTSTPTRTPTRMPKATSTASSATPGSTLAVVTLSPTPGSAEAQATATQPARSVATLPPGSVGRILFTTDLGGLFLYSVDPADTKPKQIGQTDAAHSTCNRQVSTADGQALSTYSGPFCALARIQNCVSPDGRWEAIYSAKGREDGSGTIRVQPVGDESQTHFVFDGMVTASQGIRWAPNSSGFIFYSGGDYFLARPGNDGFQPIGNGEIISWSPDSTMLLIKGINEIGLQRLDGTPLQFLIQSQLVSNIQCPVWRGY